MQYRGTYNGRTLIHYRTPGSRNGYSKDPNYIPVGQKAKYEYDANSDSFRDPRTGKVFTNRNKAHNDTTYTVRDANSGMVIASNNKTSRKAIGPDTGYQKGREQALRYRERQHNYDAIGRANADAKRRYAARHPIGNAIENVSTAVREAPKTLRRKTAKARGLIKRGKRKVAKLLDKFF